MKHIFLNLKRFDIPAACGGVNSIAPADAWAEYIIHAVADSLVPYQEQAEFVFFFPEAHIIPAAKAGGGNWRLGCQGVFRADVEKGGNFGAFTTCRTAKSMAALGCEYTIIGHCEERRNLAGIMEACGGQNAAGINRLLNQEILRAQEAGLRVLYCIGEQAEETERWQEVLQAQLEEGLRDVDLSGVVIGYEPLWAIGPGRPVPGPEDIQKVARFVKRAVSCPIVYGGGLKEENAAMIAGIPEMDGGLIALTRFQGEIGFYPDEYLRIIQRYLSEKQ